MNSSYLYGFGTKHKDTSIVSSLKFDKYVLRLIKPKNRQVHFWSWSQDISLTIGNIHIQSDLCLQRIYLRLLYAFDIMMCSIRFQVGTLRIFIFYVDFT